MNTPLSSRDIIVVGQQPWDTLLGSNCKDIALEFSGTHRVLYVNAPLDRNTVLRERNSPMVQQRLRVLRGEQQSLEAVAENLWVLTPDCILESINWLPASRVHSLLNKLNNQRFAKAIRKGIAALNFQDYILFNDNDIFRSLHLKELLKPDLSVYYSRDFILAGGYWKKHGLRLEPAIIAKSDLCVANSSYLADYCRRYNPQAVDVGQGCDAALFLPRPMAEQPADLQGLSAPVIGYVGALVSSRLDIELLGYLAQQRPQWSLVLVGPEDDDFKASTLHQLPNVHFLGQKPTSQLPDYVQHFDVCLNPQVVNQLTVGNYPRKVDEYLALGKPVVATRTEAMSVFKNHTYLASSREDYLLLIEQALTENTPARQQQRRAFAATHTWPHSVARIYEAMAGCYAQHGQAAKAEALRSSIPLATQSLFSAAE
ncbi:MAG: glycosyltransferase family 1 protein [Hymenobacter sp.]|nr:MAG: glycosyltransferase family 1 protein [Hymenobacter sp.]